MKQNIMEIKGEIDKSIIMFDDSHISLPGSDRTTRQKIIGYRKLDTINHFKLISIDRIINQQKKITHSFQVHTKYLLK